mgnify:CR=1 FL=1
MLQFPTIWEMFFEWIRDMKVDLGEFLHLDRVPFVMLENSQARLYSVLVAGYVVSMRSVSVSASLQDFLFSPFSQMSSAFPLMY